MRENRLARFTGKQVILDLDDYYCECEYRLYYRQKRGVLFLGYRYYASVLIAIFIQLEVDEDNLLKEITPLVYMEDEDLYIEEAEGIYTEREWLLAEEFFEAVTEYD